mmetsp:Transcript_22203/g.32306  ORF Transcript_22203/g.32306 Transcript_22203/m.32306 type:complete len:754 (-) Transcript_22203:158-2419(-)
MPTEMSDTREEMGGTAATQSNIRDIVNLVKSGKINKSDAFNELRHMLKHPVKDKDKEDSSPNIKEVDEDPLPPPMPTESVEFSPHSHVSNSSTTPRFSKEDRRLLINKLIEKKRQDRVMRSSDFDPQELQGPEYKQQPSEFPEYDYPEQTRASERQEDFDRRMSHSSFGSGSPEHFPQSAGGEEYRHTYEFTADGASSISSGFRSRSSRPQSAGRAQRPTQYLSSASFSRRAQDDSRVSDLRAHKIAQQEAATRAEMFKECTFAPKVKPLPASYGPAKDKDTQFYERVMRWQREKEIEATRRRSISSQGEVEGCTFRPKVNKNSSRSVKMARGETGKDTTLRLYESSALTSSHRARFIEEEQMREAKAQEQECTFKPRVATRRSGYSYVETKYDKVKAPTAKEVAERVVPPPKDCTFTPKVKGVRRNMSSAKLYVSMDVVDRLTKPVTTDAPPSPSNEDRHFDVGASFDRERPVMDVASFMGSLQQNGGPYNTPSDKRRRPHSAPRTGRSKAGSTAGESLTEEEREARKQNFNAFLGRQTQTILRKQKKAEELTRSSTPNFRPRVNRKSTRIVQESQKGGFMDRVQQDVVRREMTSQKITGRAVDSECSFQPELSTKAQRMRPRSVYEMSRGDLHKRETNQRILRLRTEQEELQNLTFQPAINVNKHRPARSALQLKDNPGGFLERHMIERKQQEAERARILEMKAQEELKDCTFTPRTKDCPAYVKRIAKSLSVVKAARSVEDAVPVKPQWK